MYLINRENSPFHSDFYILVENCIATPKSFLYKRFENRPILKSVTV
jgi:hypothetical protein